MRRPNPLTIVLSLVSMLIVARPAAAQRPDPSSPRWKGVVALQELFASVGDDAVTAFMAERVSPAVIERHGEAAVHEWLVELRETHAGLELTGAQPQGEFIVLASFGGRQIRFELEPEPPHRFVMIGDPFGEEVRDDGEPLTWDSLEARLQEEAENGFAGAVLVIRDGEPVVNGAFGLANAESRIVNTPDTIFAIGSTPIDFTKAGILLLMEDGKVAASDPITKYFDHVPSDKRGITVEHLMTGGSGLRDFHDLPTDRDPDHAWIDRNEAVWRIFSRKLLFEPGTDRTHSHSAWGLLAAIIEIASGQTYPQFTRERLFEPAGMKDTGFFGEDYAENRMAIGYGDRRDGEVNAPPYWGPTSWLVMGSGGQVSTTGDMVRWHEALRGGLLTPESQASYFERPGGLMNGGDMYGYEIFYTQGPGSMMVMISNNATMRTMPRLRDLALDLADLVNADLLPKFSLGIAMVFENDVLSINRLVPGSAAERDGLKLGDVLISAGGESLTADPLGVLDPYLRKGEPIPFVVERDGERVEIVVTPNPR